ncbi:hypothetical protein [Loigolactobacillus binensis]|uniref:Alpha/beta hydrolase n=1 Tax=Loigolactobacillus binensis TaxID=2559922 RepID=A0ABW3EDH5_9LACO|nr:hypothetical protein [Loigolactobacillus binensis]
MLPQLERRVRCPWHAYYPAQKAGRQTPIAGGHFPLIITLNLPAASGALLAAAGNIVCQLQFPPQTATTPTDYPHWLAARPQLIAANKQASKQTLLVLEQLLSPRQVNSATLQAHILAHQIGICGSGLGGSVALELLRRSHLVTAASGATNFLASQKWAVACQQPQLLVQTAANPGLTPIFKRARKRAYLYTAPHLLTATAYAQLSAAFFAASFAQQSFQPPMTQNWLSKS